MLTASTSAVGVRGSVGEPGRAARLQGWWPGKPRASKGVVMTGYARAGALVGALAVLAVLAWLSPAPGARALGQRRATPRSHPSPQEADNLRVVGYSDLGGDGLNFDVAVAGDIAIVGTGLVTDTGDHTERYNPMGCVSVSVKVVDLSDPRAPAVAAEIPLPAGVSAAGVDVLEVDTPSFSGPLAAVALDDGPSHTGPTACPLSPAFTHRGIAFYDLSNPAEPAFLGRYLADEDDASPDSPPCGPPPEGNSPRCATGQHSVDLVQRSDGKVLAVSTEPGTYLDDKSSGPVRIVDASDPRVPVEVGSWPADAEEPPLFSNNGCRPASSAHDAVWQAGGARMLVAFMDDGIWVVDTSDPSAPVTIGKLDYATERTDEGNAAYVTPMRAGGRTLALLSEEDWSAPDSVLRIEPPDTPIEEKLACEAHYTLFDPERDAQVFYRPGSAIEAPIVYVGRGCPARTVQGNQLPADPYLADPTGKIVLVDRAKVVSKQPDIANAGCRNDIKTLRAQQEGAVGMVVLRVMVPPFAPAPYAVAPGGMPAGLSIPAYEMDTPDGDELRERLCPEIDAGGNCTGGVAQLEGALVDEKGAWGGLRVVDISRPAEPRLIATHRAPTARTFPPPDLGIYAPHHSAARGRLAYVAWNSDGLRVLDLHSPGRPRTVGVFVPADTPDPTGSVPGEAYVTGVALTRSHVVIVDLSSGLYVLDLGAVRHGRSVSLDLAGHLSARGRVRVASGFDACARRVPVRLQRRSGGAWVTVSRLETDRRGRFSAGLPDLPGRYRAFAPARERGTDPVDLCRRARSGSVVHAH